MSEELSVDFSIESYVEHTLAQNKFESQSGRCINDNKSADELFQNLLFWKIKLQHRLNLKFNKEFYQECILRDMDNLGVDADDEDDDNDLNNAALKYHVYSSALLQLENKQPHSDLNQDSIIICDVCDYENALDAKCCSACEEVFNSEKKSFKRALLSDHSNNKRSKYDDPEMSLDQDKDESDKISNHSMIDDYEFVVYDNSSVISNGISSESERNCDKGIFSNDSIHKKNETCLEYRKWDCEKCTFANGMDEIICGACGTENNRQWGSLDDDDFDSKCGFPFFSSQNLQEITIQQSETSSLYKWKCCNCKCLNCFNLINCEACLKLISPECKWSCGQCEFDNQLFAKKCGVCAIPNEMIKEYKAHFNSMNGKCTIV